MATETQKPEVESTKKTLTLNTHTPTPLDLNQDSSTPEHNPNLPDNNGAAASKASTTAIVSPTGASVNDIQKKMKRAERFGVPVKMSEEEKRNSRSERLLSRILFLSWSLTVI